MCLESDPEFVRQVVSAHKKRDYLIGYKMYLLSSPGGYRSVKSPYMCSRIDTKQRVVQSSYKGKATLPSRGAVVGEGIHFFKTRGSATALADSWRRNGWCCRVVKVYAKVSDLLGVGEFDAAAKKIIIDYKDLKRLDAWVNGGKK